MGVYAEILSCHLFFGTYLACHRPVRYVRKSEGFLLPVTGLNLFKSRLNHLQTNICHGGVPEKLS